MSFRIAITGATGFVGRLVVENLIGGHHHVSALVREPARHSLNAAVRWSVGDLKNNDALSSLVAGADVVVHIAGAVTAVSRQHFLDVNCEGTIALAKAALAQGVKRFVYVSSLAATLPGLNAYAESKAKAEAALLKFSEDMQIVILRPAAIYGPGDTATLPLLKALLSPTAVIPGTPTARFSMVHVDDVSHAIVAAALNTETGTFYVSDGESYGWPDLISIVRSRFGTAQRVVYLPKTLALAAGQLGDVWASLTRKPALINSGQIKQLYHDDWRVTGREWPMVHPLKLGTGLPQTILWYQAQGKLPKGTIE
jgi:nucleoside-diphosphate-sugar epimerase